MAAFVSCFVPVPLELAKFCSRMTCTRFSTFGEIHTRKILNLTEEKEKDDRSVVGKISVPPSGLASGWAVLLLGDEDGSKPGTAGFAFVENLAGILEALPCPTITYRVPLRNLHPLVRAIKNAFSLGRNVLPKSIVLYYGMNPLALVLLRYVAALKHSLLVPIVVEWPESSGNRMSLLRNWQSLYRISVFRCSHAAVVISRRLENEARRQLNPSLLLRVGLPGFKELSADSEFCSEIAHRVTYCGDIDGYLDDVLFLVRSWVEMTIPVDLLLIGRCSPKSRKLIRGLIPESDGQRAVHFLQDLSDQDLRRELESSYCLALPLVPISRNEARFPFKALTYLSAKRPIIASNVGDVGEELSGLRRVLLSSKHDVFDFSARLDFSFSHNWEEIRNDPILPQSWKPDAQAQMYEAFFSNLVGGFDPSL